MTTQYTDIVGLSNGAQFFTADLHVHSYGASHDVKDATMTPEAIVDQAVKDGLGVLAITDHNSTLNTRRAIEHALTYAGRILVLAAVEVTTANGHLLAYFAPDAVEKLETFIARLSIVGAGTNESHTAMSMADVAAQAQQLSGVCIAAHIDRDKTGFEMLAPGYPNWKKDIIKSPAILGVEVDDPAKLVWYSSDDESTPTGTERKKLLEARAKVPGLAARGELAHVQNSDAHSLSAFALAHKNRALTRFKMDELTFDSLRTALADPEARVRATVRLPPSIPRIVGMHVDGGFLHMERYRLSNNLTCFIGGRGTGKSTALKCLAYGLGASDDIAEYDNCPDCVVVYCLDGQGILYRYERLKGTVEPTVKARESGKTLDAPVDSFRVEYYGQGALTEVARDPLANAQLFQTFLDRHTRLGDQEARSAELLRDLDENSSALRPLEQQAAARTGKASELDECNRKLQLAEDGHLKDIVAEQAAIGAEKALARSLDEMRVFYQRGITLEGFLRDYNAAAAGVGQLTGDARAAERLLAAKATIEATNAYLNEQQGAIAKRLRDSAKAIEGELKGLSAVHQELEQGVTEKAGELKKAGLTASLAELNNLIKRRGRLANEIAAIDQKAGELKRLRSERAKLAVQLDEVRTEIMRRRRDQVREINKHLARVIDDYTVAVVYEEPGFIDDFLGCIRGAMQGQYFQDEMARKFCAATSPAELARLVRDGKSAEVAKIAGVGDAWARRLVEQLSTLEVNHALEVIWKQPAPMIRVLTKAAPTRQIPVKQLSDGQRHTILLTIAMLAESEVPLVIDQPEDDLDNAFIFTSVVRMLRDVKERRQVVLVTHNANIAVLGDAELLFPMRRSGERGTAFDSGSIDRSDTKAAVQKILEGGEIAFLRRKEIYGH